MGRCFRAFAAAVLALAATAALAVAEPTSDPLLKAYPLEQRPATDVNVAPLSSGAAPNAAVEQPRAAAAEPTPADPAPSPPARPPTALPAPAPRDGVLCQIRWECDGTASWFTAVPTKFRDREPV